MVSERSSGTSIGGPTRFWSRSHTHMICECSLPRSTLRAVPACAGEHLIDQAGIRFDDVRVGDHLRAGNSERFAVVLRAHGGQVVRWALAA
jgi:hypothetical protein